MKDSKKRDLDKIGTTGNISVDLVFGAIKHYARFNRTVKIANLSGSYWKIFKRYMEIQAPELEIPNEGIQFNNIIIRKGSMFQGASIKCELNPVIALEDAVTTEDVKVKPARVIAIRPGKERQN